LSNQDFRFRVDDVGRGGKASINGDLMKEGVERKNEGKKATPPWAISDVLSYSTGIY